MSDFSAPFELDENFDDYLESEDDHAQDFEGHRRMDRPRSRLILQELAARSATEEGQDAFAPVKSKVSPLAVRAAVLVVLTLVLTLIFFSFLKSGRGEPSEVTLPQESISSGTDSKAESSSLPSVLVSPSPTQIVVHVAGAVAQPGVLSLKAGARGQQAVDAAGGLLPEADVSHVNLAQQLEDGQQLYIPVVGEPVAQTNPTQADLHKGGTNSSQRTININTATLAELDTLPNIGPATAQKIIDYRQTHGKFSSLNDLLAIPGIGQKTIAHFEGLVSF